MRCFLFLLLLATAASRGAAAQAPISPIINWKAPATLPTYLLQQVLAQYAPPRLALNAALASAAGTRAYRDSARAHLRRVLRPLPARTPLRARVVSKVLQVSFLIEKAL